MSSYKYRAFISYSHKDKKWADWLHKAIETYKPPKKLVGQNTERGAVPTKLSPVFRDREELPTATDLGRTINQALTTSATQIVICSPNAAQSKWVNEEILSFKRLDGADRIFCLIVDGEPGASSIPGQEHLECFPEALRFTMGEDGKLSDQPTEPIAADARPGKDGKPNAKLKLIAGMLGVGFDALKQREQQRRQRRLMIIAAGAIAGMVITTTLATLALFARAEAERQRVRAEAEAETARQTTDFMVGLFVLSDPSEARGNTITAREILDAGARRIRTELAGQPKVQATLMDTMGTVYKSLGLYPEAGDLLDDALERRRAAFGDEHPDVAETLAHLAEILSLQANFDLAEPMYREALDTQRRLLGDDASEVADTLVGLAELLSVEGRFDEAELLLRESLEIRRKVLGEEHLAVAKSLEDLGMNLFDQGDYESAEMLLDESIAMRRKLLNDEPHPELADGLNNLGIIAWELGNIAAAKNMYEQALEMNRQLLDELHPTVAVNLNNLAMLLHSDGDYAGAERYYRDVIEMRRKALGDEHPEVARALNNLAFLYYDQGEPEQALTLARESLEMYERVFGDDDNPDLAATLGNVGAWLTIKGSYIEAEPALQRALDMRKRLFGDEHVEVAISATAVAQLYVETERFAEAKRLARDAGQILAQEISPDHWRTAWAGNVEGAAMAKLAEYEAAERLLLEGHEALREGPGSASRLAYIQITLRYLADLYQAWGKPDLASRYRLELQQT